MPRIVDRLASAIAAGVFRDDAPILADHDPIGISMDFDRRPTVLAVTEYLLLSRRTRQVFDTEAGT